MKMCFAAAGGPSNPGAVCVRDPLAAFCGSVLPGPYGAPRRGDQPGPGNVVLLDWPMS